VNLLYFLFTLLYKPAIDQKTNYINMFVSVGFIVYEILLFAYGVSNATSAEQSTWSYALLIVAVLVLAGIICWMLYRLFIYIKVDWLGIGKQ
jgi:hypothetical protein